MSYKCFGPILLWCCFVFVLIVVLVLEIVDQKRFGLKNCWVQKNCCPKKLRPNLVSNSWDIPDLDKSYCDSWHLLKMVPGTYFWSLVKFRSATAETNVARTNNTWINVTMTVWISSRWSNEFTFKVRSKSGQYQSVKDGPRNQLLKFGQIQVSNSWDITDMDKCRQDKCGLDKCRHVSWNQFKMVPGI